MLTCRQCKDEACPGAGSDASGCDDFTGAAIEEEPVEWQPTLEDYKAATYLYTQTLDELSAAQQRIESFEKAIAELVKWAQGDETP